MSIPTLPPTSAKHADPKSLGIHTQLLTEPQDKLSSETLLPHLMHIEAKDVTLKYLFDHVRNYVICGALLIAGFKAVVLKSTNFPGLFMHIAGGSTLVLTALALFGMNYMHGITAFSKIRNLSTVSKVGYIITTVFLFMGAIALFVPQAA